MKFDSINQAPPASNSIVYCGKTCYDSLIQKIFMVAVLGFFVWAVKTLEAIKNRDTLTVRSLTKANEELSRQLLASKAKRLNDLTALVCASLKYMPANMLTIHPDLTRTFLEQIALMESVVAQENLRVDGLYDPLAVYIFKKGFPPGIADITFTFLPKSLGKDFVCSVKSFLLQPVEQQITVDYTRERALAELRKEAVQLRRMAASAQPS